MNRRHIKKLARSISKTRLNADLWRCLCNMWKSYRIDKERECRMHYPTTLMLELTNVCNLHCTTCAREQRDGADMALGVMDKEKAYRIIDEVAPYLLSMGLTGMGETFLNPHLLDVARYVKARKKSMVVSASTNANFPNAIDKILPVLPYIDTLQVSIDGLGEVYEQIRKGGRFKPFVENLDKIVAAKPAHVELMLNMVITQENYHQMADVIDFAAEHGIGYLNFTYYNLVCSDFDVSYYDFFSSSAFVNAREEAERRTQEHSSLIVTGLDFPGAPSFRKCPFMWNHLYITWDGYMVPCCGKPFPKRYNFGNVFERDVISVINSDKFCAFRRAWQANEAPSFCHKCHFLHL